MAKKTKKAATKKRKTPPRGAGGRFKKAKKA